MLIHEYDKKNKEINIFDEELIDEDIDEEFEIVEED